MEIQRVNTLAFAVSEDGEKKAEKRFKSGTRKILALIPREKSEIVKGYLPMVDFKLGRPEKIQKGILSSTTYDIKENHFYVDLTYGELYHMKGHKIERYDLLNKVVDLPQESVRTLGHLLRYGESLKEDLNPTVVMELGHIGLIKTYTPSLKGLSSLVMDEVLGEPEGRHTIVKERVNVAFHIPKFSDRGYDLSLFLDLSKEMVESYVKSPIEYSVDKLSTLLRDLFDAKVELEAITFMPYVRCEYLKKNMHKRIPEMHFPICFTNKREKHKEGIEIKPLSLSTEIGARGSVPVERVTINFSDVAGLDDIKEEIKEEIVYPILRPDLAKEFGRKAGGGILLYGPPGCGKSYVAKATIGECGASFFNVNISDLVSKGFEEGAKALHDIFEHATKGAPSIVFMDEIDAIGGKRDSNQEHSERMLIDQLLMEIDGVESMKENVLFIAATNSPWALDSALRRSERFTKQLFVPPPDSETRIEIFKIHTRKEPLSEDINLEKLAELTEGYSSSDIKTVCDSAAKIPWEEAIHGGTAREINMSDFIKAISKQKSSLLPWYKTAHRMLEQSGEIGLYENYSRHILRHGGGVDQVKTPEISFKDVGNLKEVKEKIRRAIIYPLLKPDLAKEFGKKVGGGFLLYGPPGCGKTYIARATAGECNASFFNVKITDIMSPERGESEKKIRDIFERASINTPAILFFDEIDAIAGRRDLMGISEVRLVDEFLTEMDGFRKTKGLMVMAATNAPWAIDPALRRSERFTEQIFIPVPNFDARIRIFDIHCRDKPIPPDINLAKLASLTDGYSSSDIKAICDSVVEIPWAEAFKGGPKRGITLDDFIKIIRERKSSLTPWVNMAKKELEKSGEENVYRDLYNSLLEFNVYAEKEEFKKILEEEKLELISRKREELKHLEEERTDLKNKIGSLRNKYLKREITLGSFRGILGDYEKQLIELDLEINKLKPKKDLKEG
ncbi:MAG: AAA family ATPase [Candidatus Altiarchaeota archaeon]|nr:AAA family ATPase [Candidatus Altiarchaeota archaeon]